MITDSALREAFADASEWQTIYGDTEYRMDFMITPFIASLTHFGCVLAPKTEKQFRVIWKIQQAQQLIRIQRRRGLTHLDLFLDRMISEMLSTCHHTLSVALAEDKEA